MLCLYIFICISAYYKMQLLSSNIQFNASLNVDILGEQKKVTFKFSARDLLEKNCGRGSWKRRTPNPHDLVFAG
jgi:hypothetical protein